MKRIKWYVYLNSIIIAIIIYGYIVMVTNAISTNSFGKLGEYFCNYRAWLFVLGITIFIILCYRYRGIIYRQRFVIAIIVFIICIFFEINGSSIGMWCNYLGVEDKDILLGISRLFRSDEWAVSTPMMISQYYDAPQTFSYFSHTLRGCSTDIFLEYGQPVKDILMLFRPFQIGYLFLPIAKGMAFYWCGRWIAISLVSFEFGMLLTDKNKKLAVIYAMLVTFAPIVQWWFAINGLVEMLIFAQLSIILLRQYMIDYSKLHRLLCLSGIMICAGGYVLTFYPAWQVPIVYVLLGLAIWVILDNYKLCKMSKWDWISIICIIFVFLVFMLRFYDKSAETIQALLNTVYPGSRTESGGGVLYSLFNYPTNMWYAIENEGVSANTCESAQFYDLFPIQYILLGIYCKKTQKRDKLSIIMGIVGLFLGTYCIIGFPSFFSRITLLSFAPAKRAMVALGFCNIILLVRILAKGQKEFDNMNCATKILIGCAVALITMFISYNINVEYYSLVMLIITTLVIALFMVLICFYSKQKLSDVLLGVVIVVMLINGLLVNPVRSGISSVMECDIVTTLRNIDEEDKEAIWIVEDWGLPMNNLGLLSGLSTINSTNVYPDIERWKKIDVDGKNMDIYNRYAHIKMVIKEEGKADFQLEGSKDAFSVELTREDLIKLNVKYILTSRKLDSNYEMITSVRGFNVYKIHK